MSIEFEQGLQQVAFELRLTKNVLTSATKEQLEIAASNCSLEIYKWETSEASFLLKDGQVKDAKLTDGGIDIELLSNGMTPESLYEDFKSNGVRIFKNMKSYVQKSEKGLEVCGYVYPENENFDSVGIICKYLAQRCLIDGEKRKDVIIKEICELVSLSDLFKFKSKTHVHTLIDNHCN